MAYYSLRPLMRAAVESGWDVEFACADGDYAEAMRAEGFRHRVVPMTRSISLVPQLRAISTLASSLRRQRPDLVHTHTPVGGVAGRSAARIAGVRNVVHTLHGLPFTGPPRSIAERAFLLAERLLVPATSLFLSQSAADAASAARLGIAPADRTIVIGNGVDLGRFKPDATARRETRSALGIASDAILVTTVARLVREKGLIELADAALALRADERLTFLVIGRSERSDRSHLEEELAAHPVMPALGNRWRLLGRRDDVERLLQASDVFVLPTHREGLPRSVIEAMATGLPVVASDIPACRELIEPDRTGLLVPAGDSEALAAAIARLSRSSDRETMGSLARSRAESRHDERRIIGLQLELLRKAVSFAEA
jgi:glycosyltransferase involved in cell wall biosynthesis